MRLHLSDHLTFIMSYSLRNYRSLIGALSVGALAALAACGSDSTGPTPPTGFLAGTSSNHEIGVVVNSTGKALTLFQLGSPSTQRQIPLGTSSTVTPTGLTVRGRRALVPLGDAASAALIDLESQTITRYFTFASGNATGVAFADDTTMLLANPTLNIVGRTTVGQAADAISKTSVPLAPQPTDIVMAGNRAFVVSANIEIDGFNVNYLGNGIVTELDPTTLAVVGTVATGDINATAGALGPDGLLYVLNTGDYAKPSSMTIIDPATVKVVTTVGGIGVGAGAISIDANGLAYISNFFGGTVVWNTKTRTAVRGPDNPLCAPAAKVGCRGAFAATTDASGDVYQLFFGDAANNLPPYAFVYKTGSFALVDSVAVGTGPAAIAIRSF